jgi:hypothetical protein
VETLEAFFKTFNNLLMQLDTASPVIKEEECVLQLLAAISGEKDLCMLRSSLTTAHAASGALPSLSKIQELLQSEEDDWEINNPSSGAKGGAQAYAAMYG